MELVIDEHLTSAVAELETQSTNNLLNHIIHDTQFYPSPPTQITTLPLDRNTNDNGSPAERKRSMGAGAGVGGKRKRKRRAKVCKNKEEAETQRMTHIVVERNRRKLMNEHLAVLRSLMPGSFVQRGDQASIVGGAIEYVKELEHILQNLEAQKLLFNGSATTSSSSGDLLPPPFSQFFSYPQYTWTQIDKNNNMSSISNNNYKCTAMSSSKNDVADIEVSMIETHANLRILSRRSFLQLSKMVSAFDSLSLSILHLNVTTLDPLVLYSISAKVEEGCQLTSADNIAGAVHHMLRIIEEESALC